MPNGCPNQPEYCRDDACAKRKPDHRKHSFASSNRKRKHSESGSPFALRLTGRSAYRPLNAIPEMITIAAPHVRKVQVPDFPAIHRGKAPDTEPAGGTGRPTATAAVMSNVCRRKRVCKLPKMPLVSVSIAHQAMPKSAQ